MNCGALEISLILEFPGSTALLEYVHVPNSLTNYTYNLINHGSVAGKALTITTGAFQVFKKFFYNYHLNVSPPLN